MKTCLKKRHESTKFSCQNTFHPPILYLDYECILSPTSQLISKMIMMMIYWSDHWIEIYYDQSKEYHQWNQKAMQNPEKFGFDLWISTRNWKRWFLIISDLQQGLFLLSLCKMKTGIQQKWRLGLVKEVCGLLLSIYYLSVRVSSSVAPMFRNEMRIVNLNIQLRIWRLPLHM